jgi:Mrp family chromosome partitioning ATPase
MAALLGELPADSDVVIVDTTPLLIVSDAFPLLDKVDAIVGVTRLNQTPRDAIRRMLQIARSAGGRVAGLVATDAMQGTLTGYGYGYGYGAGYGRSEPDTEDVPVEPRG